MRRFKQFVYGFFYLAILSGITFVVYSTWFKTAPSCFNGIKDAGERGVDCGGVCQKICLPFGLSNIEISGNPFLFRPTLSSVSAMAQVKNTNSDFAAKGFPYKFVFYDNDNKVVKEINGESFIYASEIKYVGEFNLVFDGVEKVATVDFSAGKPEWVPKSSFEKPDLSKQYKTYVSDDGKVKVDGSFVNSGSAYVPRLTVFAVFYSKLGQIAGVSKSEIENVAPGQQKNFSVSHPPLPNLNLSATQIYLYGD